MPTISLTLGFDQLGLSPKVFAKVSALKFQSPTPIQSGAVPIALKGVDVIGIAQTGTGKTLAFSLPMLERLRPTEFGLVLAPTRELAMQIEETLHKLGVSTALIIGGASINQQVHALRARPQVVVATPGRLIDHMDRRSVNLRHAGIVVLDEADRMLDMGFAPAIRRILAATPPRRQTMMFSATMPPEVRKLSEEFMEDPETVEVTPAGTPVERIQQEVTYIPHANKPEALNYLLEEHAGTVLVFARTRHGARKVAKALRTANHSACEIHSDRTMAQRKDALTGFKSGRYRVMVATDIAARGIDVKEIELVVNYDLPDNPEDYVHRIGRTGRAGHSGRAITLATPEQAKEVRAIERVLKRAIPVTNPDAAPPAPVVHMPRAFPARNARQNFVFQSQRSARSGRRG